MRDSLNILYASDYVEHHGVKGMKWGVRRQKTPNRAQRIAEKYAISAAKKVKKKAEKNSTFKIDVKGAATKIKYSSSKPKVAKITSDGVITTKKVGNTVIKAKVNGKTLSFKLKVYVKKIVNRYKETFKKGYTYMLYYSEVGKTPTIVSDNPKVVKVTKSGKLKAKKRGKATVTFSHKNAKAIVKITVK